MSFVIETYQLQVRRFTLAEAEGCLGDETGFWQTCFFVSWPAEVRPDNEILIPSSRAFLMLHIEQEISHDIQSSSSTENPLIIRNTSESLTEMIS